MNDLESKTKEQLLDLAGEHDIPVARSLLKRELVALLKQFFSRKAKKTKPASGVSKSVKSTVKGKKKTQAVAKVPDRKKEKITFAPARSSYPQMPSVAIDDMAQEAKFVLGGLQMRDEARDEAVQDLPSNYGNNRLTLMVRDPYWVYSYWEIQQDNIESGLKALGKPHEEIHWVLRVHTLSANKTPHASFSDTEVHPYVRTWYLNLSPCGASFYAEIGLMDRQSSFYRLAVSNKITLPLDGPSDVLDERWMTTDEEFRKLYALAGGFHVGSGSEAAQKGQRLQFGVSSGSFVSSLFSPTPAERQRKFRFWVDAELIVYGGTEPDAKVTLRGQRIELRSDGTFTARFALPDGTQTIPVSAQSADNIEIRTIIPVVARNTERPEPVVKQEEK